MIHSPPIPQRVCNPLTPVFEMGDNLSKGLRLGGDSTREPGEVLPALRIAPEYVSRECDLPLQPSADCSFTIALPYISRKSRLLADFLSHDPGFGPITSTAP